MVPGANRGIGLALAQLYSRRGWQLHGSYREQSEAEADELLKIATKAYKLDLGHEQSISNAAEAYGSEGLDLLINCGASIDGGRNRVEQTSPEQMLQSFKINVVGPLMTTKAFLPNLRRGHDPKIINISSSAGSISDNRSGGLLSYRVSKAALNMLSVNTALELAAEKIACIALHPGWIKTRMTSFAGHMGPDEAAERMIKVIDAVDMASTGKFFHRDGHELTW